MVWLAAASMSAEFECLRIAPTRSGWHTCTTGFLEAIRERAHRLFGDYSLKRMIDALLVSQPKLAHGQQMPVQDPKLWSIHYDQTPM